MNKKLIDWWTGGASFNPTSLSPLVWWDNGSTYMASDGSQWTDRMGLYNMTAAGTARPTFTAGAKNGLPSFTFNGTTNVLTASKITQIQAINKMSIWAVGRRFSFQQYTGAASTTQLMQFSDNLFYANLNGNFGTFTHSNNYSYSLMLYDGTQATNALKDILYVNGVARTLSFTGTIPTTTENNGSAVPTIGKHGAAFLAGEILELGIVTRVLTASEISNLNSYLSSKYAI